MIYGAYSSPQTFWEAGGRFDALGVNALFLHSARVDAETIARAREQGAAVYAEFGTFRGDSALASGKHPDVAKKMERMHNEDPKRWGREHRPKWEAAPEMRSRAPA